MGCTAIWPFRETSLHGQVPGMRPLYCTVGCQLVLTMFLRYATCTVALSSLLGLSAVLKGSLGGVAGSARRLGVNQERSQWNHICNNKVRLASSHRGRGDLRTSGETFGTAGNQPRGCFPVGLRLHSSDLWLLSSPLLHLVGLF